MRVPYTPTVLVSHSANYNAMQPLHTNYPYYAYEIHVLIKLPITADFFVQNEAEAKYWDSNGAFLQNCDKKLWRKRIQDRGLPQFVD